VAFEIYMDTPSGVTIIAGDAAMNVRYNVEQLIPPGFLDRMADTMRGLRKLARDGRHILMYARPGGLCALPAGSCVRLI
jgi:hypothetical protein